LSVELGQGGEREVRLVNVGAAAVSIEARIESHDGMVQLIGHEGSAPQKLSISGGAAAALKVRLSDQIVPAPQAAYLHLYSDDDERDLSDRWNIVTRRYQALPIRVEAREASSVTPSPRTLLLKSDATQKKIKLICRGSERRRVLSIDAPEGFVVEPTTADLEPGKEKEFSLRITGLIPTGPSLSLSFRLDKNETLTIPIRRTTQTKPRRVPRAIIGIDFGTAFTSVAYRRPSSSARPANSEDIVDFLFPLSTSNEPERSRFRTRIWVGRHGQMRFGDEATAEYRKDEGEGFLFREIKTLLREPEGGDALIYPPCPPAGKEKDAYLARRAAVLKRFGTAWEKGLVTEYLRWIRSTLILPRLEQDFEDPDIYVRYVFSLPVLDRRLGDEDENKHPRYARQVAAMKACLEAAEYPMDAVDFELEPVCAALGLVRPPTLQSCSKLNAASWPRLATERRPLETGSTIALFDSGGGTTDVVVMEAALEPNGQKFSLGVLQCLGVDSEEHTFGGEAVTTEMLNLIPNARTEHGDDLGFRTVFPDLTSGDYSVSTMAISGAASYSLRLRDDGESLKRRLAGSPHDDLTEGDARIKPRLLQDAVAQRTKALGSALSQHVFHDLPATRIKYYLLVGGNTAIPAVERWVQQDVMNDMNAETGRRFLNLPQKDRDLAVCYGTVWVPDAQIRSIAPYRLRITADLAGDIVPLLDVNPARSDTKPKWQNEIELPPGTLQIKVMADFEGTAYLVDEPILQNARPSNMNVIVIGEFINGKARLKYHFSDNDPADAKTLWEYEL
jgi:hypothetical protein